MRGKDKCRILRDVRVKIAEENNIPYHTEDCGFEGECKGTCPKCESEVRYLEREIEKKKHLGQKVAVAAVAVGISATMAACAPGIGNTPIGNNGGLVEPDGPLEGEPVEIDGGMEPYDPDNPEIVELDGDVIDCPDGPLEGDVVIDQPTDCDDGGCVKQSHVY